MNTDETTRIRVATAAELIEAAPYLLGFHPSESLVLIGLRPASGDPGPRLRVGVSVRIDLDNRDPTGLDQLSLAAVPSALAEAGCDRAVALFFTETTSPVAQRDPALGEARRSLEDRLAVAFVDVIEAYLVTAERAWSLTCAGPECCPPEGWVRRPGSAVAAELTYAGLVARPDREALLATLDGRGPEARARLGPALHRADERLLRLIQQKGEQATRRAESAAFTRAAYECQHGRWLSDRRLVRFGAALRDGAIRDALWLSIDASMIAAAEILTQLHSALPSPYDAAPMFLFGWSCWRQGQGTLAAEAAERTLRSDPHYSAATLLAEAIRSGMDPYSTPLLTGQPR